MGFPARVSSRDAIDLIERFTKPLTERVPIQAEPCSLIQQLEAMHQPISRDIVEKLTQTQQFYEKVNNLAQSGSMLTAAAWGAYSFRKVFLCGRLGFALGTLGVLIPTFTAYLTSRDVAKSVTNPFIKEAYYQLYQKEMKFLSKRFSLLTEKLKLIDKELPSASDENKQRLLAEKTQIVAVEGYFKNLLEEQRSFKAEYQRECKQMWADLRDLEQDTENLTRENVERRERGKREQEQTEQRLRELGKNRYYTSYPK